MSQFTLSLPHGGVRYVLVKHDDDGKDEAIGRVVGDFKVGFEPQALNRRPLCDRAHLTARDAAEDVYACWLLRDLGATVIHNERRYEQCDGTCTVDCGHCKGAGKPASEAS